MFSGEKCLFRSFAYLIVVGVSYILEINPSPVMVCKYFYGFSFHSVDCFLEHSESLLSNVIYFSTVAFRFNVDPISH